MTRVAGLTGIAASDLSQIERGARPAFPGWRRRLAHAFGMPEEALFAAAEDEKQRLGEPPG
jgi:transcriptional regulator with XRE-family HTH domain